MSCEPTTADRGSDKAVNYLERFLEEYRSGRVNLALTDKGYEKYAEDPYPGKLRLIGALLHAAWFAAALFFAFRTSETDGPGTLAVSLGGMLLALLIGRFVRLGPMLEWMALFLGLFALPFDILAGPVGLYGLNSVSKRWGRLYGEDLVKRRLLESEERFRQALTEGTVVVTASDDANEGTRSFLARLEEIRKQDA